MTLPLFIVLDYPVLFVEGSASQAVAADSSWSHLISIENVDLIELLNGANPHPNPKPLSALHVPYGKTLLFLL